MSEPIRALIFDMDGLLVDSEPLAGLAMRKFLQQHGHEMKPELTGQLLGKRFPEVITLVAEAYHLTTPFEELSRTYEELRLAALRGNLTPMPGAAALLAFARDKELRLALATSSMRAHADLSLAEAKLAGLFDAEATGDEVERGKPEPDLFLLAAQRLGEAPASCVVLEDAPAGVAAAAAAGMRCICVPNVTSRELSFPVAPDVVLPDLLAVIPWLEEQGVECWETGDG